MTRNYFKFTKQTFCSQPLNYCKYVWRIWGMPIFRAAKIMLRYGRISRNACGKWKDFRLNLIKIPIEIDFNFERMLRTLFQIGSGRSLSSKKNNLRMTTSGKRKKRKKANWKSLIKASCLIFVTVEEAEI